MSNAELIKGLRYDARDYGREVLGLAEPGEVLSWDERHKRAWLAADALETAASDGRAAAEAIAALGQWGRAFFGPVRWDGGYDMEDASGQTPGSALAGFGAAK